MLHVFLCRKEAVSSIHVAYLSSFAAGRQLCSACQKLAAHSRPTRSAASRSAVGHPDAAPRC